MQSLPTVAANTGNADVTIIKPRFDAAPAQRHWYACADELQLALRIAPGAMFGENADGELVLVPDDAVHAAGFDIVGEQLWLNPIAGNVSVDKRPATAQELMQPGARVEIGDVRFRISQGISESDAAPVTESADVAERGDVAERADVAESGDTVRLPPAPSPKPRLVEPLEVVDQASGRNLDLTIDRALDRTEEITRIIRVAETNHRTPSEAVNAAHAQDAQTIVRMSERLKTQTKSFYQHSSTRVAAVSVLLTTGLLLAAGYTATFFDGSERLTLGTAQTDANQSPTSTAQPGIVPTAPQPVVIEVPSIPQTSTRISTLSAAADTPEGQISDLITLVQAGEVNVPNNDRVLSLVAALQPTPHRLKAMTYLRLWKIRLLETTNLGDLEQMAETFRNIGAIGDMRVALDERTQILAQLKTLNKQARDLYIAGELYVPGATSVVSIANEMLKLDPTSRDALTWQRRAADALVIEARDLVANNRDYEARNLVEEVLDFNPNHPSAVELWNALIDRT